MKSFPNNKRSFFSSNTTPFDHQEIVFNFTIMREPSHRSDLFLGQIEFGHRIALIFSFTDSENSFILLCSMMISVVTRSGDRPLDIGRMPGSNTTDSSQPSMSFSWQFFDSESLDNSGDSVTLGHS